MLLAIDVGNTNTVFAVFQGDVLEHSWRCKTESARSADEYAVFLKQLFDLVSIDWSDISGVVVSSVVPDTNFNLKVLCEKYAEVTPVFVDAHSAGVPISLSQPQEVGADRLANAAYVISAYDLPAVVVDFGTATTFDVIDKDGVYSGGIIAPGVRLSISALAERAAKLPQITVEHPETVIGKDTRSAMQSGMYWGYIGMIEKILSKIEEEIGEKPYVIATGGLAPLYAQSTAVIDMVDDSLILKGLLEIYKRSQKL